MREWATTLRIEATIIGVYATTMDVSRGNTNGGRGAIVELTEAAARDLQRLDTLRG